MPDNNEKIKLEAAQIANIKAIDKLLKMHKNNKISEPIEFERYILSLYEKNLKELSKNQK